jgi:hypothetical protein
MPLIDVTCKSGYKLIWADGSSGPDASEILGADFGPALPALFIENKNLLGLDASTLESGVQVQQHVFGQHDVNVPEVWIKVQFSENAPSKRKRVLIRDKVIDLVVTWFHENDHRMPDNLVLDVLWGPTSGCGFVGGTFIEW